MKAFAARGLFITIVIMCCAAAIAFCAGTLAGSAHAATPVAASGCGLPWGPNCGGLPWGGNSGLPWG
jgi:hypothetical protein